MNRVIELYRTQLRIVRRWQGGPVALVRRLVITLLVGTIAFVITAWIVPGIDVGRIRDAIVAILLIAGFNALVRPALLLLVAPFSLLFTAILVLVLQVVAFLVVAPLSSGVVVDGFLAALIGSFVFAAINSTLTSVLGLDRTESYFGMLVQQLQLKRATAHATNQPGLVIVQIDGLAHPILAGRVRAGSVNTMAGWIRSGSHVLSQWEPLLPSMTSA